MNITWTEEEKLLLLEALEMYGVNDTKSVASHVTTKTEEEVKHAIHLYERIAIKSYKDEAEVELNSPIDKWIQLLKNIANNTDVSKDIVSTLRIIAHYEPHDDAEISLSKCYEFIADLMAGKAAKKLSKPEEKFIIMCVSRLAAVISNEDITKEVEFLNNIKNKDLMTKSYVSKRSSASVVMDPQINFLKVPQHLLKNKKV